MIVEGWASTEDLDSYRHVVKAGAFDAAINRRGLTGPRGVRLLAAHDSKLPLGRITQLETKSNGKLYIKAEIDEAISWGKDWAQASKAAGGLSFSVGFYIKDADMLKGADGEPYLYIISGDLDEVSVVVFPANAGAVMTNLQEPQTYAQSVEQITGLLAKFRLMMGEEPTPSDQLKILRQQVAQIKEVFSK